MLSRTMMSVAVLVASAAAARAQTSTAFTYQGRLTDNGQAADGAYDLHVRLWPAENAIFPIGNPVELDNVQVERGQFTVQLDFGPQFSGADRWLSISVRPGAGGSYTALAPRQHVTPTPYAISAASLSVPVYNTGATDPTQFTLNPLLHLNQTGAAAAIVGQTSGPEAAVVARTTHPGGTALRIDGGPIRTSGPWENQPVMSLISTPSNTSNGVLTLDHPLMNGDANAVILVTPRKVPAGFGIPDVNPIPVFLFYDHSIERWRLRGFGGAAVPHFSAYHVLVIKRDL